MYGVVLQQMGQRRGIRQVVHGHHLEVGDLQQLAQGQSSDPPQPVDGHLHHNFLRTFVVSVRAHPVEAKSPASHRALTDGKGLLQLARLTRRRRLGGASSFLARVLRWMPSSRAAALWLPSWAASTSSRYTRSNSRRANSRGMPPCTISATRTRSFSRIASSPITGSGHRR